MSAHYRKDRQKPVIFAEPVELVSRAVRDFARYSGVEPRTVCGRATGSWKAWTRLRFGRLTIRTMEIMVQYLSDNWPHLGGPVWPDGLVRPGRSTAS